MTTQPTSTEDNLLQAQHARRGCLFLLAMSFALPLLLAALFVAWSLALAAWFLLLAQVG